MSEALPILASKLTMKNILLLFLLICVSCVGTDQLTASQVPLSIRQQLHKEYIGVKKLRWSNQDNYYIAQFRRATYDYVFVYDQQGKLVQKIEEINCQKLPVAIQEQIKTKYPNYILSEAALQIVTQDTLYRAEIQRGLKFYYLYFKTNLNFVKQTALPLEDKKAAWDFGVLRSW